MFTLDQISAAHSKVKSGADFPAYIQEIKALGVTHYQTHVRNGHTDYHGAGGHQASTGPKHPPLAIAPTVNPQQFAQDLRAHQQGHTDYPTFLQSCATNGIHHWIVRIDTMTCTYHDPTNTVVLTEAIPE